MNRAYRIHIDDFPDNAQNPVRVLDDREKQDLFDLAVDIYTNGQETPVVVRFVKGEMQLLQGFRRIAAIKILAANCVRPLFVLATVMSEGF